MFGIGRRVVLSSAPAVMSVQGRAFSSKMQHVVPANVVKTLQFANTKRVYQATLKEAITKYQKHKSDTGSAAAQIAGFTERIQHLMNHMSKNHKDNSTKRGFQILVAKRRKMLRYLRNSNYEEYTNLIKDLGIRGN